jgi:peptidoglycan/xylan/chitin deacetylase (PgdA/CDA1 family)
MKILITLDYEVFFGANMGTYQKSIINPTNELLKIFDKFNVKASFFVDSGYLIKLKKYDFTNTILKDIKNQLEKIIRTGHDVQLHIHPHWEDSIFNGKHWKVDVSRYKLQSFNKDEIDRIVSDYKDCLVNICGDRIFSYRAGGWCIQPFNKIKESLKKNGIWLDSTLFEKGVSSSKTNCYNFRGMPKKDFYRFEDDPIVENAEGYFIEIPISSYTLSPFFFWKFAFFKKFGGLYYKSTGDGYAIKNKLSDITKKLLTVSSSVVSLDGYKASFLEKAFLQHKSQGKNYFVIIGHPKAISQYSLDKLHDFIEEKVSSCSFVTYNDLQSHAQITNNI